MKKKCGLHFHGEAYIASLGRVDDPIHDIHGEVKTPYGWLVTIKPQERGFGDAIILGPHLRKVRLNLPKDLVIQWVKDAPRKATLWNWRERSLFPKHRLLVVLEEWISPTWCRLRGIGKEGKCDQRAALRLVTADDDNAPTWQFIPSVENMPVSSQFCNGNAVIHLPPRL